MGLYRRLSYCSPSVMPPSTQKVDINVNIKSEDTRNPNPKDFSVIFSISCGEYVVAEVLYPNCINYEGRKILVFKGITEQGLKKLTYLDPHFSIRSPLIARFAPTPNGWDMAVKLVEILSGE